MSTNLYPKKMVCPNPLKYIYTLSTRKRHSRYVYILKRVRSYICLFNVYKLHFHQYNVRIFPLLHNVPSKIMEHEMCQRSICLIAHLCYYIHQIAWSIRFVEVTRLLYWLNKALINQYEMIVIQTTQFRQKSDNRITRTSCR